MAQKGGSIGKHYYQIIVDYYIEGSVYFFELRGRCVSKGEIP